MRSGAAFLITILVLQAGNKIKQAKVVNIKFFHVLFFFLCRVGWFKRIRCWCSKPCSSLCFISILQQSSFKKSL
jgi:hypothetical protein